jgi:DNA/RNA endonuclease G (NUC1)
MMHRLLIVEVSFTLLVFFPFMESIHVRNFRWCLDSFYLGQPPTGFDNRNTISDCVNTIHSNGKFYYAIKYDLYWHIPLYAAYQVNSFNGKVCRASTWHVEPDLPSKQQDNTYFQASPKDYIRSTYDKGHLFPALYNRDSREKMFSTFTLINAAPMSIQLNRGVWKSVESNTLHLLESNCIFPGAKRFVITGTVPGKNRIKNTIDGINIPEFVWNAIYCDSSNAEEKFKDQSWSLGHLARQNDAHYTEYSIEDLNSFLTNHMRLFYQPVKLFNIH